MRVSALRCQILAAGKFRSRSNSLPSTAAFARRNFSAKNATQHPFYAEAWVNAVELHGRRSALVFDGAGPAVNYSFNELESRVNRLSRSLRASYGIEPGDLVVTVAENRPELITLMLSCQKLGAAFVPLASDLSQKDCRAVVNLYEPKLVISDRPQHSHFPRPDGKGTWPTMMLPAYRETESELLTLESIGSDEPVEITVHRNDPGIIFSTSGSTGLPKGVVYSNDTVGLLGTLGVVMRAQGIHLWDLEPGDSSLLWVPIRGVGATLLSMMMLPDGVRMVMVESKSGGISTPEDWAPLIDKYDVKYNMLFGAAMHQMLQIYPERTFPSVRDITYGGSCFPPSLVQSSMAQFPNARFKQGYAMTECLPIAELGNEFHKRSGEASEEDIRVMATAGKPHPMAKVFIEDLSQELSGKPPPPDSDGVGQICAWSPFIMKEYFKNPLKTAEAIGPDGFMRTGDVGKMDDAGRLHVIGRTKELIPTHRGFNVAPRDIEEVLYQHRAVGQAAVVGMTHPSGAGEMVVAWVTPKAGSWATVADLRDHCVACGMPQWQLPELFNISSVALPTVGGKIAKKTLQSPDYTIATLADIVAHKLSNGNGCKGDSWYGLAHEVFQCIDSKNDGVLDLTEMRAVFSGKAECLLQGFASPTCNDSVNLSEWLAGISQLEQQERISWLTQTRSLLATSERSMFAGTPTFR